MGEANELPINGNVYMYGTFFSNPAALKSLKKINYSCIGI